MKRLLSQDYWLTLTSQRAGAIREIHQGFRGCVPSNHRHRRANTLQEDPHESEDMRTLRPNAIETHQLKPACEDRVFAVSIGVSYDRGCSFIVVHVSFEVVPWSDRAADGGSWGGAVALVDPLAIIAYPFVCVLVLSDLPASRPKNVICRIRRFYNVAMIASRGTPLCRATDRRIETKVPRRSGSWSGTTIR